MLYPDIVSIIINMNDVQDAIRQLREKGWTLSAVADAMGMSRDGVDLWRAGKRYPSNAQAVRRELDRLLKKKRIPKRKRYNVLKRTTKAGDTM